jgi:hypothetical protein
MKRRRHVLVSACLAMGAGTAVVAATAAEDAVLAQDLVNVRASNKVAAAIWTHRPDSYTLQVVLAHSPYQRLTTTAAVAPATSTPQETDGVNGSPDRSSFFIGNTIANLRCMDPAFGDRTLTLVDGRRVVPGSSPPASTAPSQPATQRPMAATPPPTVPPRIQVWLLRADGTQIIPSSVSAEFPTAKGCGTQSRTNEVLYRFPLRESAQAAAVAISVDDQYFIEKLRPLE